MQQGRPDLERRFLSLTLVPDVGTAADLGRQKTQLGNTLSHCVRTVAHALLPCERQSA